MTLSALMHKLLAFLERLRLLFFRLRGKACKDCQPCIPAIRRPDPFLYSQQYLMSLGLPVTWDNPDIFIFDGDTPADPHDLKASTPYTVVARVWNGSTEVPVVGLPVRFSYLSFGMGTETHPIDTVTIDLGAKGLPGCPAFAYTTWTTPSVLGHYCLQVLLEPPDDSNWLNNLGQRNTQVAQAKSPAIFSFRVGNFASSTMRAVHFTLDTYAIPPLPRCEERVPSTRAGPPTPGAGPPVPGGWTVTLSPPDLRVAPWSEEIVEVAVEPPPSFSGTLPLNVTGHDHAGPIGGVTLLVEVP
jgi:hypothetical protein